MSYLTQPVIVTFIVCSALLLLAVVVIGRKLVISFGKFHAEFSPNGGKTMRDAVDRIEDHMRRVEDRVYHLEHPPVVVVTAPVHVPVAPDAGPAPTA